MPYDATDPRSALGRDSQETAERPPGATGANVAPQYFEFDRLSATEVTSNGSSMWWVRSQACVVNYCAATAGDTLSRSSQPDEYAVMVSDPDARVIVRWGGEEVEATGRSLIVVPPGDSEVSVATDAAIVRLFAAESSPDLCDRCANREFYSTPDPNVAQFEAWPDPTAGHRIRCYGIDDVAPAEGRFGRIFRCSTLMVNWLYGEDRPRNTSKMSPHHHDDFEQISLQLAGDYIHHIRTPWTVDMAYWRDDEHQHCSSPSVTVIPPPSIHTSQGVGDMNHQLVDIFCPPRHDFSARPGWVLNDSEYPVPDAV